VRFRKRLLKGKDEIIAALVLLAIYGMFLGTLGLRTYEYFFGPSVEINNERVNVHFVHRWAAIYGTGDDARVNIVYVGSDPASRIITKIPPQEYYTRIESMIEDSIKKRKTLGDDYIENRRLGVLHTFEDLRETYGSVIQISAIYRPEVPKIYVKVSWSTTEGFTIDDVRRMFLGDISFSTSRFESPEVYVIYFVWYNGLIGIDFLEPFGMLDVFSETNIVLAGQSFVINQSIINFITKDLVKADQSKVYSGIIVLSEDGDLIFRAVRLGIS